MRKTETGATLLEVLITMAIFISISTVLVATINQGITHFKRMDTALSAEHGINLASSDLNMAIRNSDITTASSKFNSKDGSGLLTFKNAAPVRDKHILSNQISYKISSGSPEGEIKKGFRIVYFTALPEGKCKECRRIGLREACPHKILVKRWYLLVKDVAFDAKGESVSFNACESPGEEKILNMFSSAKTYSRNKNDYDKILAKNVIAFVPENNLQCISYTLKMFRPAAADKIKLTDEGIRYAIKEAAGKNYNPDGGDVTNKSDRLPNDCTMQGDFKVSSKMRF